MAAVVLALGASLAWGVSDFLAGRSARRSGALAVLLVSQLVAVVLAAAWTALSRDAAPDAHAAILGVLAGLSVLVALGAFYQALTLAPMSIVASLGATGVVVPVVVGIAAGERPAAAQVAGIALATAGVALAARRPGRLPGPRGNPRAGIALALVAAAAAGAFLWLMARASRDSLPWAVLLSRAAGAPVFAIIALATDVRLRAAFGSRADVVEMLSVGLLGFSAGAMYAASTRHGLLSLTSVLSSLAPAVTVLLAWRLIGERLDRSRWAGVAAAVAGVLLIAAG
jgi:drug/metabolite transporter (DMT)-like permease